MRRQHPDTLTAREREVLNLIRHGLTNEEIADRLGISLDGAKYHVSQILSKLGVATREEAATVALGERRRWWAGWPVAAKIAAGAAMAAAVAGLGLLALGVIRNNEGAEEQVIDRPTPSATTSGPTVIGSYDDRLDFRAFGQRMAEAIRTGDTDFFVQNTTFVSYACDQRGLMPPPPSACSGQPAGTSIPTVAVGYLQSDGGIAADEREYRGYIDDLLANFDSNAGDEYGNGQTQLYAWAKIASGRASGLPGETVEAIVSRITESPTDPASLPRGAAVYVFHVSYLNDGWTISSISVGGRGSGPGVGSAEGFINPEEIASEGFLSFWSRWEE